MHRIAILTPDPRDEAYDSRWRDVLARNAAPLEAAGFQVEGRCWADADDLPAFDLVLPLLVWGYPRAHRRWIERVTGWEGAGVRLHNGASVLRWNADKRYLGRLAERGAPVVPTLFADRVTLPMMEDAAEHFGSNHLVAKPQISSTAWQTIRWSPGSSLEDGPTAAALIQPYMPAIESDGEVSMIYFGGRFSHAIRKRPQQGEFRVQPEFSGIITRHSPEQDELTAAERILAAVDEPLLYARVDLVRDLDGAPALIELELIEPDLYLGYDPAEGRLFVEALRELVGP